MSKAFLARPEPSEYSEYHDAYISKVPGDDILSFLQQQLDATMALMETIDEATGNYRYESGKWSIKEVLGHITDSERVFAYRAAVFARGDNTPLPGFDQDIWAKHAPFANVSMRDIAADFQNVRRSTISLLKQLDSEAWNRRGTANNKEVTTRALAFMIGGHTQHHLDILKTRYLDSQPKS
jgi:hypothetical protein